MDILLLQERVQQTLQLRESQFREFKSALEGLPGSKVSRDPKLVAKDIAETLVSFANADGGELLVGVEDDGTVTGISYNETVRNYLLNVPISGIHKDTPLIGPSSRLLNINGKNILYFAIEKSTTTVHQTSDGRCLQRKDNVSCPVSATRLQFERHEQISREYDRQFVDGAQVCDLNLDLIKRASDNTLGMTPEKCLQYFGVAEYGLNILRLRRAALLLFANDISKWHPRCQVRVLRVRGIELKTGKEYNVISDERATGNILELISNAWDIIRPHLVETRFTPDALFKERVMYPEDACREALINAITHRDYSIEGQSIEILIFDDRMEIHSPGALLSTINIDELRKLHGKHDSRNALIARVLREIGYVREMGEGMRRIFRLMSDADLVPPEIISKPGLFSIALHHKSVFNEADQKWLEGFSPLKLSRDEMLIALLGKNNGVLSPRQIYDHLNLVDWDIYRSFFERMFAKGIIHNTMSEQNKNKVWRKEGLSKRDIKRLTIRQPDEIERGLSELYFVLNNSTPVDKLEKEYMSKLLSTLPEKNPFKTSSQNLRYLLELLGLINLNGNPTQKLLNLWKKESFNVDPALSSIKVTKPTENVSIPQIPHDVYVGNLDYATTEQEIRELFNDIGSVLTVTIPKDFVQKRGRGFCFVKMASKKEVEYAINNLNGIEFKGRQIFLNWAK